jgi:hypothetical protein
MKRTLLASSAGGLFLILLIFTSCRRNGQDPVLTPVPFLTGRTWLADTILPTPPMTFNQLSSTEQQQLVQANAFFKIATLRLNDDGTIITTNWDFGFTRWKLVNNDQDIEMQKGDGTRLVLRNWEATATRFSYTLPLGNYEVNYQFKY